MKRAVRWIGAGILVLAVLTMVLADIVLAGETAIPAGTASAGVIVTDPGPTGLVAYTQGVTGMTVAPANQG
ncbi:MAG: hypothetical protein Q4G25_13430 [Paracoccus sp. (in: a-proteobacteria)]|nr:hypothetical protein [Paracoccus sp. (in: a-proteobacteria)]